MLIDEIVKGVLEAAAGGPDERQAHLEQAFHKAWDVGYLPAGVAPALDAACMTAPLEVSAVARAAILNRPEWYEQDIDDRMPEAWEAVAIHLAASMGATGLRGVEAARATADMGDGGRIALAGLLNPVMQTPSITELHWHPELTYPPVAAIAMLNDSCTLDQITYLAENFTTGREDPSWVMAPFFPAGQNVFWPEWEAVLEWIAADGPTGSPAWWAWLLSAIEEGVLDDSVGAKGSWRDVPVWEALVHDRLGWLLESSEELPAHQRHDLPVLRQRLKQSTWPAVAALQ